MKKIAPLGCIVVWPYCHTFPKKVEYPSKVAYLLLCSTEHRNSYTFETRLE